MLPSGSTTACSPTLGRKRQFTKRPLSVLSACHRYVQGNFLLLAVIVDAQSWVVHPHTGWNDEVDVVLSAGPCGHWMGERVLRQDRLAIFQAQFQHGGLKWSHEVSHRMTDYAQP